MSIPPSNNYNTYVTPSRENPPTTTHCHSFQISSPPGAQQAGIPTFFQIFPPPGAQPPTAHNPSLPPRSAAQNPQHQPAPRNPATAYNIRYQEAQQAAPPYRDLTGAVPYALQNRDIETPSCAFRSYSAPVSDFIPYPQSNEPTIVFEHLLPGMTRNQFLAFLYQLHIRPDSLSDITVSGTNNTSCSAHFKDDRMHNRAICLSRRVLFLRDGFLYNKAVDNSEYEQVKAQILSAASGSPARWPLECWNRRPRSNCDVAQQPPPPPVVCGKRRASPPQNINRSPAAAPAASSPTHP